MSTKGTAPTRFVGLDVHKYYLIAVGVDAQLHEVLGPVRVPLPKLLPWAQKNLTPQDTVVLEMTTSAFHLHDDLIPYAARLPVHPVIRFSIRCPFRLPLHPTSRFSFRHRTARPSIPGVSHSCWHIPQSGPSSKRRPIVGVLGQGVRRVPWGGGLDV